MKDIFDGNSRFFRREKTKEEIERIAGGLQFNAEYLWKISSQMGFMETSFLYHFSLGFQPRYFDSEDDQDKFIYEEGSEVCEMYFFIKGIIGIAINNFAMRTTENFYSVAHRRKGYQLIGDHYVINKRKSGFLYIAMDPCNGYGITKKYVHQVMDRFPDVKGEIHSRTYRHYI